MTQKERRRYVCKVREKGGRLGVVLVGDEYDQAPPFLYEEADYVSGRYACCLFPILFFRTRLCVCARAWCTTVCAELRFTRTVGPAHSDSLVLRGCTR